MRVVNPGKPRPESGRLPALDGLRGCAALLVVLNHYAHSSTPLFPGLFTGRQYGVSLLFFLSAFLLTLPLLGRPDAELLRPRLWIDYAVRRFLRIYPLFTIILVLSVLRKPLGLLWMYPVPPRQLGAHLLLQSGVSVLWSIGVIVKYYCLLPLVVLAIVWVLRRNIWLCGLVTLLAIAIAHLLWPWVPRFYGLDPAAGGWDDPIPLARYLPTFLLGSFGALVQRYLAGRRPGRRVALALELLAGAALLILIASTPFGRHALIGQPLDNRLLPHHVLLLATLWFAFVLGSLNGTGLFRRALEARALRLLGLISFGVYFWHIPARRLAERWPVSPLLAAWGALGLALALAALSYLLVERPFTRVGATIGGGRKREQTPAEASRDRGPAGIARVLVLRWMVCGPAMALRRHASLRGAREPRALRPEVGDET